MGDMADFVNDGIMRQWEHDEEVRQRRDPIEMYEEGLTDELGYEPYNPLLGHVRDYHGENSLYPCRPRGEGECPVCGKDTVLKKGKFGEFYGCTGFPGCKGSRTK